MKIKQYRWLTIGWCWLYWRQWYVHWDDDGVCFGLGPLGVTIWKR